MDAASLAKLHDVQAWLTENEKLCQVVNRIDEHFLETLRLHERSFITAYKQEMVKVEKELAFLKNKQREQAGRLMKDDDVTSL
jgi:hypothetical protein